MGTTKRSGFRAIHRTVNTVLGLLRRARSVIRDSRKGRTHTLRLPYMVVTPSQSPVMTGGLGRRAAMCPYPGGGTAAVERPLPDLTSQLGVMNGVVERGASAPVFLAVLPLTRVPAGEVSLTVQDTRVVLSVLPPGEGHSPVPRGFVHLPSTVEPSTLKFSMWSEGGDVLSITAHMKRARYLSF